MNLKWFKTGDVDEFADAIVADMVRRFPPHGVETTARKANAKLRKTHQAIFARAQAFALSTDLNVYRTARLGNRVKWSLAEAGYVEAFVEAFTHELVTVVTLAGRVRRKKDTK